MKIKTAFVTIAFVAAAGCGDDDTFTAQSGTYTISDVSAPTGNDQCNLVDVFSDTVDPVRFGVTVSGQDGEDGQAEQTVVFNPGARAGAGVNQTPTSTLTDNILTSGGIVSFTQDQGNNCVTTITREIRTGELTGDDTMTVTFVQSLTPTPATAANCTVADLGTDVLPCTSEVELTLTRQGTNN